MKRIQVQMERIGRTGLQQYGGYVSEEWYPPLQGQAGVQVFKMMKDNSAVCAAMLYVVEMFLSRVQWRFVEAGQTKEDLRARDFIKTAWYDMTPGWTDVQSNILSMLPFGWAYLERLYKLREGTDSKIPSAYDDGYYGWETWEIRSQDSLVRWEFDDEGNLTGMTQQAPPDYQERTIPLKKALLFTTTATKGNPEGRSLFRGAYRSWYNGTNIEDIESIGIERDLAGYPLLYAPEQVCNPPAGNPKASRANSAAKKLVTNLKRDKSEGALLPSTRDASGNLLYELKLLSTAGVRQFNTSQIITRYDSRIAMTLLADFLLLGTQRQGSYALADNKTVIFNNSLKTILDRIAGQINAFAIPDLIRINPFDLDEMSGYPRVEPGEIDAPSIQEICQLISAMAGANFNLFDDVELENHLRRRGGLPVRRVAEDGKAPRALVPPQDNVLRQRLRSLDQGTKQAIVRALGLDQPAPVQGGGGEPA